jgi:hypothetical protein
MKKLFGDRYVDHLMRLDRIDEYVTSASPALMAALIVILDAAASSKTNERRLTREVEAIAKEYEEAEAKVDDFRRRAMAAGFEPKHSRAATIGDLCDCSFCCVRREFFGPSAP